MEPDVISDTVTTAAATDVPGKAIGPGSVVRRHRLSTRLWHWTNALTLAIMLMSGLMIFNAHPRLYWGQYGANFDRAWFEIGSIGTHGYLRVGALQIPTTGVLGTWHNADGKLVHLAFPGWATIPTSYSLADARVWHLAFAWVLALALTLYLGWSLYNRHIQRDLRISAKEAAPRNVWHDIKEHAHLRFPTGRAALKYNILQKISYSAVLFGLIPLMIATGLTMSPNLNAGFNFLLHLFGGRQSARSLHFIAAAGLLAFFFVHIAMVVLAGPLNEMRSIVTGKYRLPGKREDAA